MLNSWADFLSFKAPNAPRVTSSKFFKSYIYNVVLNNTYLYI